MASSKEVIKKDCNSESGNWRQTLSPVPWLCDVRQTTELNTLVCHMVTITPSSQICSWDTKHLHYFYIFLDGGELSGEKQRHRGPVHSPEFPAPTPKGPLYLLQKGDLALEHCATELVSSALPWLQDLDL